MSAKRPAVDIPPTPDSSATSSPTSTFTATQTSPNYTALTSAGPPDLLDLQMQASAKSRDNHIAAISQLLTQKRGAAEMFAQSLSRLETETRGLVSLGSAINVEAKVDKLREELTSQGAKHRKDIDDLEGLLRTLVEDALKQRLKNFLLAEIERSVGKKIKDKVRQKLQEHLPRAVIEQTDTHEQRMLDMEIHLHNGEARRINATLSSEKPLKKLLLPRARPLCNADSSTTRLLDRVSAPTYFPETSKACLKLTDVEARDLARDYDLLKKGVPPPLVTSIPKVPKRDGSPIREDNINAFMDYIGVPFHCLLLVPNSTSASPVGSKEAKMILLAMKGPRATLL